LVSGRSPSLGHPEGTRSREPLCETSTGDWVLAIEHPSGNASKGFNSGADLGHRPLYSRAHRAGRSRAVVNTDVAHPLMARLELPYPLLVGRLTAGRWSSQVPDELVFEGRLGVAVGAELDQARAAFEAAVAAADDGLGPTIDIRWHGGQFAPAQTPVDDPFVTLVHAAAREQSDPGSTLSGVPYGADMRQFCARGIPCVMLGAPGLERAHATDEWVSVDDLVRVSRAIALTIMRFGRVDGEELDCHRDGSPSPSPPTT
jgi:acetylornithine deacetylase/succinyl-diaminopimelate desuccinylase-like protein